MRRATKASKRLMGISGMSEIVERRIPVLSLSSPEPGPVVWLTACIHGDEAGGTVIVHDVFREVRSLGLRCGELHALPLVNPMGFENVSRYINSEHEDLNRCFPGEARGTMGERMARRIYDTIAGTGPALVIDLHNDWIQSVPYILLEPAAQFPTLTLHARTLDIACASRLLLVEDCEADTQAEGTLAGSFVAAGVPAFTIEAGGAGSIVESSVRDGCGAVIAILRSLGLIDPEEDRPSKEPASRLFSYTNRPLSTTSGIVRFAVVPGEGIEQDQTLARVYSAVGACEETLRARAPGIVLGLSDHAAVIPGREVIAIAERLS